MTTRRRRQPDSVVTHEHTHPVTVDIDPNQATASARMANNIRDRLERNAVDGELERGRHGRKLGELNGHDNVSVPG